MRAGYTIHTTLDANVGYIAKTPGQTQFYGVAVDALQDKGDGFGADYLTDELQPDGRRLIKLAYTAYPTPSVTADRGLGAADARRCSTIPARSCSRPTRPTRDRNPCRRRQGRRRSWSRSTISPRSKRAHGADGPAQAGAVGRYRRGVNRRGWRPQRLNDIVEDVEESLKKDRHRAVHPARAGRGRPAMSDQQLDMIADDGIAARAARGAARRTQDVHPRHRPRTAEPVDDDLRRHRGRPRRRDANAVPAPAPSRRRPRLHEETHALSKVADARRPRRCPTAG